MKKTAILNSAKFNFDKKLDFSQLEKISDVTKYDSSSSDVIMERVQDQNILITKELPVPGELIRKFPSSVELICEAGTGYNNIDIAASRERNITVCNVPGYSTESVAQLAFSFILNLSSSIKQQQLMIRQKNFDNFTKCLQVHHSEVQGKVLGVIGAGTIGKQVINIARALGMDVLFYDLNPKVQENTGVRFSNIDDLLKQSDFVTLHCPLTAETKYLIDKAKLGLMKSSAFLVNTSRGALVKETDLIEALKNRKIAGAALDVQDPEPPALDNPLFEMENVIITPHIGWQTIESRQRLVERLTVNISSYINGKPVNVVN
ncbi:MAG TPA: NAD(P)-dependent oxidoreductase [Spirochaetota bacterium]|nr:NAD(P)-dependent oxidoreductase [Spirochaetota bacterium]